MTLYIKIFKNFGIGFKREINNHNLKAKKTHNNFNNNKANEFLKMRVINVVKFLKVLTLIYWIYLGSLHLIIKTNFPNKGNNYLKIWAQTIEVFILFLQKFFYFYIYIYI